MAFGTRNNQTRLEIVEAWTASARTMGVTETKSEAGMR